jgi:acetyl-CoA decarbonylase/synthase complex subunit beta
VNEKSLGEVERVWLYTAFGYPHTSCGCFEAVVFYIPEVDGLGVVHRDFKGQTMNGLPFSTMADSTAGGRQIDGFHGVSIEYMRSPKFLQVDGGWNRVVWMPSTVKERVKDFIPSDVVDKIATEQDVQDTNQLKEFLKAKGHPITERWVALAVEETVPETAIGEAREPKAPQVMSVSVGSIPMAAGGFKIILKDAKIVARKLIIKRITDGE